MRSETSAHNPEQPITYQKNSVPTQYEHHSTFKLINMCEEFPSQQNQHSLLVMPKSNNLKNGHKIFYNTRGKSTSKQGPSVDYLMEDRFIPSRKIIGQQYYTSASNPESSGQNSLDTDFLCDSDPQIITVAEIYAHELLSNTNIRRNAKSAYESDNKKFMKFNEGVDMELFSNKNLFRYKIDTGKSPQIGTHLPNNAQMLSLKQSHNYKKTRKIPKNPYKVLDAPALTDDFYLNLIAWSNKNVLAVGLGNCIYLWDAITTKVTRLCQLQNDNITSVCWSNDSPEIAIGCNKGHVLVWDINTEKQIRKMEGHEIRVGAMSWSKKYLATGSRDKSILQRDTRLSRNYVMKLQEHSQQICGLKWSVDEQYLASGGNDNKVIIWNQNGQVINKFNDHRAAVKALAWSPHKHGLLATGGGTADRMIKLRNIFNSQILFSEDTGSQVCNLQFSKSTHELVSTHGYSQNQINIWQYPNMKRIATLKGHSHRVLYLAMSPDGTQIVTGAGDQTLRFWNVFPKPQQLTSNNQNSGLQFGEYDIR